MPMAAANALIESVFPAEFGLSLGILLILSLQGVTVNQLDTDTWDEIVFHAYAMIIIISVESLYWLLATVKYVSSE